MELIYRVEDTHMDPMQLWRAVEQLERIDCPPLGILIPASLQRQGDRYVMWGITGQHSLAVRCTSADRLHAHWQGFKEIATAKARAMGY